LGILFGCEDPPQRATVLLHSGNCYDDRSYVFTFFADDFLKVWAQEINQYTGALTGRSGTVQVSRDEFSDLDRQIDFIRHADPQLWTRSWTKIAIS
jgi:hypothetical protein